MNATHIITGRQTRLALIDFDHIGNGIFADLDTPNAGRLVCPVSPDFVTQYEDNSLANVERKNDDQKIPVDDTASPGSDRPLLADLRGGINDD